MSKEEQFWQNLLAMIDNEKVIPVIGPELLRTGPRTKNAKLYRVLAERMLADEGLEDKVELRHGHELNDAVCALKKEQQSGYDDYYIPIFIELKKLLDEAGDDTLQPLRLLAGVSKFKMFVTTTPDDLLARALRQQRGTEALEVIYAPMHSSDNQEEQHAKVAKLQENRTSNSTVLFYLFGKSDESMHSYAIHDEDILEYLYALQITGPETMTWLISELRTHHLLLIGCSLPDWLTRFFIRLSNSVKLSEKTRTKEFFNLHTSGRSLRDGGAPVTQNENLTHFLECFSNNTLIHSGEPHEFVEELARRWREKHPETIYASVPSPSKTDEMAKSEDWNNPIFFLCHASNNKEAAQNLCKALKDVGLDEPWLDSKDLKSGEVNSQINKIIDRCQYFIAILSRDTEKREEGFFILEWKLALERIKKMSRNDFIIPVVVDSVWNGKIDLYKKGKEFFGDFKFFHAPDGKPDEKLLKELKQIQEKLRGKRSE